MKIEGCQYVWIHKGKYYICKYKVERGQNRCNLHEKRVGETVELYQIENLK